MSKEDVLLFTCYGKRGNGRSYMEHLKAKDKEIERLNKELEFEKLKNKEVREYIEEKIELYTVDLTEKNKNKLSYIAPIRAVYKELLEILDKVKE